MTQGRLFQLLLGLFAALFVGSLLYLAVEAGIDPQAAWHSMLAMLHNIAGG